MTANLAVELDAQARTPGMDPRKPTIPMRVDVQWWRSDPLTVELHGPRRDDSGGPWVVGRDLLAAGLDRPVGGHDVTVLPDPFDAAAVLVVLASPAGKVTVSFDVVDVDAFLTATYRHVPADADMITDEALAELRPTADGSPS